MPGSSRLENSPLAADELAVVARVRLLRETGKFSLDEWSEYLDVKRSTLANYENGVTPLPFTTGLRICQRLDVNQRWLATGAGMDRPFVELDEIKIGGLSLPARTTFLEAYRSKISAPLERWFSERASVPLNKTHIAIEPTKCNQRRARAAILRDIREWLIALSCDLAGAEQRTIIGQIELAVKELRKRAGGKIEVDATTSMGELSCMQIGEKIKRARGKLGLTQEQAAAKWGVSVKTLQGWEQGARRPRGLALIQLESILQAAEKPTG